MSPSFLSMKMISVIANMEAAVNVMNIGHAIKLDSQGSEENQMENKNSKFNSQQLEHDF